MNETKPHLSRNEIRSLLDVIPDNEEGLQDRAIIELLYAGLRPSQICRLTLGNLNLEHSFIELPDGRLTVYGQIGEQAIRRYLKSRRGIKGPARGQLVFFSNAKKPVNARQITRMLKKYSARARIRRNVTPTVIRESFAIHLLESGADMGKVLELLSGNYGKAASQRYRNYASARLQGQLAATKQKIHAPR